jgi:hypothetical protein
MFSNSKRRLASLATASAMVATMAVAAVPAATLAASCQSTGFNDPKDGTALTAAQIGGTVTGDLVATGCDIGVYNPTSVTNADIHGARYYGVVVNGKTNVNTTGSKVHAIGDTDPALYGMQRGRAILYINGASGTINGNKVTDFQKSGIEIDGRTGYAGVVGTTPTSATVSNNTVTGWGPTSVIAQNGIVIRSGANATVNKNTVSKLSYDGADTAAGVFLYEAGRVNVQNNKISNVESPIDDSSFAGGHVKP